MDIKREGDNIVITLPFYGNRYNPYDEDAEGDRYYAITGLMIPQKRCSDPEMGFAHTIDMSYKGKGDQWSDFFFKWLGDTESFIAKCKELDIDIVEYDSCAKCKGPIYSSSTSSLELTEKYGGPVCSITCDK